MTSDAAAWIETRLDQIPLELAEAIRGILRSRAAGPGEASGRSVDTVGEALAVAAIDHLERVVDEGSDRSAALDLLAADALLTYAFEAAAELGEDVASLADRVGPRGLLGERLVAARAARVAATIPGEDSDGGTS